MPAGGRDQGLAVVVSGHQAFGWLEAHVLDGIGPDFGADDRFGGVEEVGMGEAVEDRRPGPEGGIGFDAGLRQREVEVLCVDLAAVDDDPGQALAEGQLIVGGFDLSGGIEFAGQVVEHTVVFVDDRLDNRIDVEHAPQ